MQVLDAVAPPAAAKMKRKTSEHHAVNHAHVHRPHGPKTSRSESHLPGLSRTPSSGTVSQLQSDGSRRRKDVEVEVISGDGGDDDGDDGEDWESGDEAATPAGGSRKHRSVSDPAKATPRRTSTQSSAAPLPESPLDLRIPTPGHEPPATQKTTGFPGAPTPLTPASIASGASQSQLSLGRPQSERSASGISQALAAGSAVEGEAGYPFPAMDGKKETHRDSSTDRPDRQSQERHAERQPDRQADRQTDKQTDRRTSRQAERQTERQGDRRAERQAPRPSRPAAERQPTPPAPEKAVPAPLTLARQPSMTSVRSIHSLRAPHPLNSPVDTRGFDTPGGKRSTSMHFPPVAPAVVYRETVGGHGWDEAGSDVEPTTPRTQRIGSFSSVRSLKDIFAGAQTPTRVTSFTAPSAGSRTPSRRITALQAASAAARLNTTSDPVAYHQSLGFSPATAETAHFLSRFLPTKKQRRPRWAISVREAMEAHEKAAAGEEPDYRVGLTDGQYRDAHESLVDTMRNLGIAPAPRRGRSSGYHALLSGGSVEEVLPKQGSGQTPFAISVARCMAQRPRQ